MRAAAFGEGTGPIFLANVNCAPENDSTLIECFVPEEDVGVHTCSHAEDAGVVCPCELEFLQPSFDRKRRLAKMPDGWGELACH